MMYVHDPGKMGNNVFLFMQFYAWAMENGRSIMSMRFAYKYQYFKLCDMPHNNMLWRLIGQIGAKMGLIPTVRYDGVDADVEGNEKIIRENKNVMISGWYVRYLPLVEKHIEEIREIFTFKESISGKIARFMAENGGEGENIGLHIRRRDYARHMGGRFFFSDEEYAETMRQVVESGKRQNIYVCSDEPVDVEWWRKALGTERIYYLGGNPGEDMCLLSMCDKIVGTLSSFTLVAAMQRNLPIYWKRRKNDRVSDEGFRPFSEMMYRFDSMFTEE
jgi:hypothetical protein